MSVSIRRAIRGQAVSRLTPSEAVAVDRRQLDMLYSELGASGADRVVGHALEELAVVLARLRKQARGRHHDDMRVTLRSLTAIARQIGMPLLVQVARDVLCLIDRDDPAALGACIARMERIGENSLIAFWDIEDLSG